MGKRHAGVIAFVTALSSTALAVGCSWGGDEPSGHGEHTGAAEPDVDAGSDAGHGAQHSTEGGKTPSGGGRTPAPGEIKTADMITYTNSSFHCETDGLWLMIPSVTSKDGNPVIWEPELFDVDLDERGWLNGSWRSFEPGVPGTTMIDRIDRELVHVKPGLQNDYPWAALKRGATEIAIDHAYWNATIPAGRYRAVNFLRHSLAAMDDWVAVHATDFNVPSNTICTFR